MTRRLVLAAALIATTLVGGPAPAAEPRAPQPAKPVDAARFYTGRWHEIARRPIPLTDGCVAGATTYSPRPDGQIQVLDSCQVGTPDGRSKTIGGPGRIIDPPTSAKLRVRYRLVILPITREYWVLDHADDYSWFISADPAFKDLWIYTRDPQVSDQQRAALVSRAQALGYDVSKLEFPAQPAR